MKLNLEGFSMESGIYVNWLMAKQRREMLSNYIGLSLVFDIPFELEFSGKWKVLI